MTYLYKFVVHRSPVRKFTDAWEGVGHRHKLTNLVEKSNIQFTESEVNTTALDSLVMCYNARNMRIETIFMQKLMND